MSKLSYILDRDEWRGRERREKGEERGAKSGERCRLLKYPSKSAGGYIDYSWVRIARRRSINCRIMNEVNRQLDECRPPHRLLTPARGDTTFISLYDELMKFS